MISLRYCTVGALRGSRVAIIAILAILAILAIVSCGSAASVACSQTLLLHWNYDASSHGTSVIRDSK